MSKSLGLNNLKTRTTMNAKISGFLICTEVIINLLLDNLQVLGADFITFPFRRFSLGKKSFLNKAISPT